MSELVIASKAANALFEGDEVQVRRLDQAEELAAELAGVPLSSGQSLRVIEAFRRAYGGLWVGGRAKLTPSRLTFTPNLANRVVQTGLRTLDVDLQAVESVDDLPGFFTKIVQVGVGAERIKLRCYGAPAFARQIREATQKARGW